MYFVTVGGDFNLSQEEGIDSRQDIANSSSEIVLRNVSVSGLTTFTFSGAPAFSYPNAPIKMGFSASTFAGGFTLNATDTGITALETFHIQTEENVSMQFVDTEFFVGHPSEYPSGGLGTGQPNPPGLIQAGSASILLGPSSNIYFVRFILIPILI